MKDEIVRMMMKLQNNVALMQRPQTQLQRIGANNNDPEFHQTYRVVREEPKTAGHEIIILLVGFNPDICRSCVKSTTP